MAVTRIPLDKSQERARQLQERLEMSIAEMGLPVRTMNCLEEQGIHTVRQLLESDPKRLLGIANFGQKTLEEVYKALERIGFSRRPARREP